MKIEVSNGEVFDKLSILQIKKVNIHDTEKRANIEKELRELEMAYHLILFSLTLIKSDVCLTLYQQLLMVNGELWIIEDKLRQKEAEQEFDEEFIELAREVYRKNDLRCDIKRRINIITLSDIVEEKSYANYIL